MTAQNILAKSDSIIYQPGGVAGGLVVTSWAQVQKFVSARQGAVIVYVDDSIVSPAHVPVATGLTDFKGRGEIRPYRENFSGYSTLVVDDGATLKGILRIAGTVEVLADTKGATPAFDWDYTTNVVGTPQPMCFIQDGGSIGTTTTATQPAILVPGLQNLALQFANVGGADVQQAVAPLIHLVAATSSVSMFMLGAELLGPGLGALPASWITGAGTSTIEYDEPTVTLSPGGVPTSQATTKVLTNLDQAFNPSWTQAAWFIDPANSTGLASDGNDGKTALTPVLSYNGGVVAKWTTVSPTLRQTTTLTWLSSQPVGGADPVVCTPLLVNGVLVLRGGPPTVLHAGALGAVTPKNRATAQLLECDLGFAAPIGSLVQNTTAGKASRAFVYKNVAGTNFDMTQPISPAPAPPIDFTYGPVEVDTWAPGDTIQILGLISADLVLVQPTTAEFVAPNFPWPIQTYQIHGSTADGVVGNANFTANGDVSLFESSFDSLLFVQSPGDDETIEYANVFANAGLIMSGESDGTILGGAYITSPASGTQNISLQMSEDAIVDTTAVAGIGAIFGISRGDNFLQRLYIAGEIGIQGLTNVVGGILWGPATLVNLIGTARLFYTLGTAPATFLFTGSLQLNGQANANAFNPATGLWSTPIAITPANLDLAFGAGGFGGLATNVGGASISGQAQP